MFTLDQREQLDRANKALIASAKEFLNNHPVYKNSRSVTFASLRNLLDVALVSSCVEEIEAFIEYQVGKDFKKWNIEDFGTELAAQFGQSGKLKAIIREKVGAVESEERDAMEVELASRWLGYLYRYFRFMSELSK